MQTFTTIQKTASRENILRSVKPRKKSFGKETGPGYFINLQQTAGNQFVQRMLRNNPEIPGNKTDHLVTCSNSYQLYDTSLKHLASIPIQAKLTINQPGDQYEQEADRVADEVMRMPAPVIQRQTDKQEDEEEEKIQMKPMAELITPLVKRQAEEEEEEPVQAKCVSDQCATVSHAFESSLRSMQGGGEPLSKSIRDFFEPRFGYDFSQVRIHADEKANQLNDSIQAKAFTNGSDIFFNTGQYNSATSKGNHLLAHELTHIIQQKILNENRISKYNEATLPGMRYAEESRKIKIDPTSPIEITVIDESDIVGWLAAFTRTGELYMTNTKTMVDNILQALDQHKISRLNILDHGNPNGIQIGNDWISIQTLSQFIPQLSRLRGRFTATGFVHLQHCQVGQNLNLISALSRVFDATVYAGTGSHNPIYRINFGDYVKCEPGRRCQIKVGRP